MSDIKYGLISKVDAECIEATLNYIMSDFPNEYINVTEVGCYGGDTGKGILEYILLKKRTPLMIGIDNNKDAEPLRYPYDKFICGNSNEVYNQISNESQHLILIDALHTFPAVVSDFFCYAPKVMVGGYIAFHDTGKHLDPLSGWQGVGDKNDPDMCLGGVRKALYVIGLFGGIGFQYGEDRNETSNRLSQWQLIFDEADINDTGGGICVFKKMY